MTVKDLIIKLKSLPADAQVLVQGYEDGFDSIRTVQGIAAVRNYDAADFNGEYQQAEKENKDVDPAVVIIGNRR